jgi:hypothetical protein
MTSTQDKPNNFMQELDAWSEGHVIGPLTDPDFVADPEEDFEATIAKVKRAIREKVLESYHNGQKTPAGAVRQRR